MEAFLQTYHIPFTPFHDLLKTTNSLIAGSAPLALYLQQEGMDPAFIPNDLDIFIQDTHCLFVENGHLNQKSAMLRFSTFLFQHGYSLTTKFESDREYYSSLQQIKQILSFLHPSGKEIQLIVLIVADLLQYIHAHFDLSVCCTWYNARANRFETSDEGVVKREMSVPTGVDPYNEMVHRRIQKYVSRGFTLVLPSAIHCRDTRLTLGRPGCPLIGVKAYDMMELEEVDAVGYLSDSRKHMVVKSGAQFYAFHRDTLHECMMSRRVTVPCSSGAFEAYETPFNQTITHHAHTCLPYEDFSVYELIFAYNAPIRIGLQKAIFTMNAYTVEGWKNKMVGAIFAPPVHVEMVHDMDAELLPVLSTNDPFPSMSLLPAFNRALEEDLELQELLLSEWR